MRIPNNALTIALIVCVLIGVTLSRLQTMLVWNVSASAPVGLYWIKPAIFPNMGDLLAVQAPEQIARLMDERDYLPFNAVLLKRVAALSGSEICRRGMNIFVAGKMIAQAKKVDAKGRSLPQWQGCRQLGPDEIFLVNADVPDSLDGRYFGPFPKSSIVGLARPIWTDEGNDARR